MVKYKLLCMHVWSKILAVIYIFIRYIGTKHNISIIGKRLLQIKIPDNFTRSPRSITQRQYWKGKTNI